jgi:hypothetical protein
MSPLAAQTSAVLLGRATDEVWRWVYALALRGESLALGGAVLLALLLGVVLAAGRRGRAHRVPRIDAAGVTASRADDHEPLGVRARRTAVAPADAAGARL